MVSSHPAARPSYFADRIEQMQLGSRLRSTQIIQKMITHEEGTVMEAMKETNYASCAQPAR